MSTFWLIFSWVVKTFFFFYFLLTSLTWLGFTEFNITHSISGVLSCDSDFSLYRVYWAATQISPSSFIRYVLPCYDRDCWLVDILGDSGGVVNFLDFCPWLLLLPVHTFFTTEGGDSEFAYFTLPNVNAFLEARSHNVPGTKQ